MNIINYRHDQRFLSCTKAFLATGTPQHDELNRDFLKVQQTGYWFLKEGRIVEGDLMFILLPHATNTGGYPREIYAGIITKLERFPEYENRVLFTVLKFFQLPSISTSVKTFLGDKNPPQGNNIIQVWDGEPRELQSEDMSDFWGVDEESLNPEGIRILRVHHDLERDKTIVRKAKEKRLAQKGKLECEVCHLDFEAFYGERGRVLNVNYFFIWGVKYH